MVQWLHKNLFSKSQFLPNFKFVFFLQNQKQNFLGGQRSEHVTIMSSRTIVIFSSEFPWIFLNSLFCHQVSYDIYILSRYIYIFMWLLHQRLPQKFRDLSRCIYIEAPFSWSLAKLSSLNGDGHFIHCPKLKKVTLLLKFIELSIQLFNLLFILTTMFRILADKLCGYFLNLDLLCSAI